MDWRLIARRHGGAGTPALRAAVLTSRQGMTMRDVNARHIVHIIAQLRFGAGRYLVDVALAQQRRHPGAVTVVVGEDGEGPWVSSPALLEELKANGVEVL